MTGEPVEVIARPAFLDMPAVAAVLGALPGSRAVGGCVRDALAGLASADVDVAAPLPPGDIALRLRAAGLKVFETGLAHGTVTAVLDRLAVEVTALRRDVLTDGRHAMVEWTTDWREDAARRDFTINAMSLAPDGALFDYFGGRADLAAGIVRFVGDPDTRLAEDYLRVLRFFRFQARYGRGVPDPVAVAAIRRAVSGLARLSAERVWMELKRILAVPDPVATVALMSETAVLAAVLPEAEATGTLARLVAIGGPADPLVRLAALLPQEADVAAFAQRLRVSAAERLRLDLLLNCGDPLDPAAADGDIRRALALAAERRLARPEERVLEAVWLRQARDDGPPAGWTCLRDRVAAIAAAGVPSFPLLGRDLLAEGVVPGIALGRMLARLRAWWLAGGCVASREDCLAELHRRLAATDGIDPAIGGDQDGGGASLGG